MARIKAERLREGDTVGLVCPAGYVKEKALVQGIKTLEDMGLKVKLGAHVTDRYCYLAGKDRGRAEDLNRMFSDPQVKAVLCVRGGYGCTRILDMIDYNAIAQNPKILIGYSDITALHLAIAREVGLVTFHGPMVAEMGEDFPEYNMEYIRKALFHTSPLGEIKNPPNQEPVEVLVPGRAEGPVVGGNLSLLCATLGTRYEIDTRGCIFFVEEIGEPPHKIDRMLNHLRMAGKFKDASAIVFGQWTDCKDSKNPEYSVQRILEEIGQQEKKPCISNLMVGHGRYNITIPLGCRAVIEDGTIYITESGVI